MKKHLLKIGLFVLVMGIGMVVRPSTAKADDTDCYWVEGTTSYNGCFDGVFEVIDTKTGNGQLYCESAAACTNYTTSMLTD